MHHRPLYHRVVGDTGTATFRLPPPLSLAGKYFHFHCTGEHFWEGGNLPCRQVLSLSLHREETFLGGREYFHLCQKILFLSKLKNMEQMKKEILNITQS